MNATALRLLAKAADIASLNPAVAAIDLAAPTEGQVLIQIAAAAVNPSDVKAAMGFMPYAIFPRTPGRDFAGTIVGVPEDGPQELLGREVFGTSGDLGIRRDGTHATHLVVEAAAAVPKPAAVPLIEAAGIGVPFVTAMEGFRRAGLPRPGEIVLVMGVTGKVGQAATQIATWRGARVIGVGRAISAYDGHASAPVEVIDSQKADVAAAVRAMTDGHGADIVVNTVGDPYYEAAHRSTALMGRQIFIAAVEKIAAFNIFEFYRGRHTYVGIDTLALSSVASGDVLKSMLPGFASGALRPFPVTARARYALADAHEAYAAVLGSLRDRVVLIPN